MSDTADFFRGRIDQMIDLRHPLAVLGSRMPWQEIEASLAGQFARRVREGKPWDGRPHPATASTCQSGGVIDHSSRKGRSSCRLRRSESILRRMSSRSTG